MANRRHRLFLRSGIGPNLTEDVLRGFYQRFGPVVDVYIPKDPVTRQPKGFAFVSFSEELPLTRALQEQIHRIDGQNIPVARADARPSDSPADSPSFDRRQSLRSSLEGLPSPGANLARLSADQIYNMDPASAFRLGRAHELALRRSQGLALAAQDPAFLGADPGLRPPPLQESPFRGSPEAGGRVRMLDERARMDLLRSSYDGALPHQALEGSFRPSADPVFRGNDRLRGQELGPIGFRSAENALRHSWEGSLRMPPGGGNGGAAGASAGAGSPSPSSLRDRESVNGAREEANAGIRSLDLGSRQGSGNTLEAAGYREGSVGYRDGGGMSPYRESGNGITGNGQQYYAGMEGMAGERLRVGSIDRYGNPVLLDSPGVRSSGDLSAVYSRDVEMRQPLDSPQVSPYDPMDVATSYERSRGAISRLSPALERLHTPPLDYPPGLSNPAALAALSPALREGLRSSRLEPQLLLAEQLTDPDWPIPRGGRGGSAERQYAEGSGSSDGKGHRIFVGGVPDQITEAQMKAHFERYGRVEDVYFPLVKGSDRRRGFCFVRFETRRAAENAAARSSRTIAGIDIGEIKVAEPRPSPSIERPVGHPW